MAKYKLSAEAKSDLFSLLVCMETEVSIINKTLVKKLIESTRDDIEMVERAMKRYNAYADQLESDFDVSLSRYRSIESKLPLKD